MLCLHFEDSVLEILSEAEYEHLFKAAFISALAILPILIPPMKTLLFDIFFDNGMS